MSNEGQGVVGGRHRDCHGGTATWRCAGTCAPLVAWELTVRANGALGRYVAWARDAPHARQEVNVDAICTLKRARRTRWWRASRD